MFPLLAALSACSEDSEAVPDEGPLRPTQVPVLTVTEPARGAFSGDVERVDVSGEVSKGSGRLTTLTVNGQTFSIPAEGGAFSGSVPVSPGLVILGTRVETSDDERAVDGRSVLVGPVHDPGERLVGSVKLHLGPELLDDDDPDVDDVATLAETLMGGDAIAGAFVGTTLPTDYYDLTITDATFGPAAVDLVPASGALNLGLTIADVWVDFEIGGVGWYDWLSTTGSTWADAAVIDVELELDTVDGAVVATPVSTVVSLQGFGVTVEWFPDSLEDDLASWTQEDLESQLAAQVEDQMGALVGEYLSAFGLDTEFAGMQLHMQLTGARAAEGGLGLTMDAWISGDVALDLPDGAGSLATDGDGPSVPLVTDAPFAMAADDDFLNQVLFSVWASGALSGIAFGNTELTALAGEIPSPLGPVQELRIDLGMPPVMGEATWADQQLDLSIGELRLTAIREDGEMTDASVNVRTGASLEFQDDGELGMSLDNRPAYMTLEIGVETAPPNLDPGDMAALLKLSVPPLFGSLVDFVPGFPVPSIPLDSFGDVFAGQSLAFTDPTARVEDGWLIVEGALSPE